MNKLPNIFSNNTLIKPVEEAIRSLVTGRTVANVIKHRPIRGGKDAPFVDGYYMFRQAALITGFRWTAKCLKEKYLPSEENPREVGALMEVTLYDQEGNGYAFQSWGSSEVARWTKDGFSENGTPHKAGDIIALFDSLKSAYTDGIKKNLSYFGIANDVYGGREPEYFPNPEDNGTSTAIIRDPAKERSLFDNYVRENHLRYDIIFRLLGVTSLNNIQDYAQAYHTVKSWIEGGKKES